MRWLRCADLLQSTHSPTSLRMAATACRAPPGGATCLDWSGPASMAACTLPYWPVQRPRSPAGLLAPRPYAADTGAGMLPCHIAKRMFSNSTHDLAESC